MARRRSNRRRSRRRPSRALPRIALRMPQLEQRDLDLVGLGLVALAAFFAFVFYLGWDGGKVGGALADGFRFLLGGAAYLVPLVLLGAGPCSSSARCSRASSPSAPAAPACWPPWCSDWRAGCSGSVRPIRRATASCTPSTSAITAACPARSSPGPPTPRSRGSARISSSS